MTYRYYVPQPDGSYAELSTLPEEEQKRIKEQISRTLAEEIAKVQARSEVG